MIAANQLRRLFSTNIDESNAAARAIGLHHSSEECAGLLDIVPKTNLYETLAVYDVMLHAEPWHPQRATAGPTPAMPDFDELPSAIRRAMIVLFETLQREVLTALRSVATIAALQHIAIDLIEFEGRQRLRQLRSQEKIGSWFGWDFRAALSAHCDDAVSEPLADILVQCNHDNDQMRTRMLLWTMHPQRNVRLTIFYAIVANPNAWQDELPTIFANALQDEDAYVAQAVLQKLAAEAHLDTLRMPIRARLKTNATFHPSIATDASALLHC